METHLKLPEDFKKRWVAALRSGEYKQGFGYMKIESGGDLLYCCLGVACEIGGGDFRRQQGNFPHLENESVPLILRGKNAVTTKLAYMNDGIDHSKKYSFEEIATYIEENL